jgi:hypothetical protein
MGIPHNYSQQELLTLPHFHNVGGIGAFASKGVRYLPVGFIYVKKTMHMFVYSVGFP